MPSVNFKSLTAAWEMTVALVPTESRKFLGLPLISTGTVTRLLFWMGSSSVDTATSGKAQLASASAAGGEAGACAPAVCAIAAVLDASHGVKTHAIFPDM